MNSSAAVKALSTVCCTSANAAEVVNSLAADEVLMVPDRNLARNTAARTDKKVHLWDGCCPFHDILTPAMVAEARAAHPEALFLAHPECLPEVVAMADAAVSTSGMIRFARESDRTSFLVGTEVGMHYPLQKACPDKEFIMVSKRMLCDDMKKITLPDVLRCLETMAGEVKVPEEIRVPALKAVERMIAVTAG